MSDAGGVKATSSPKKTFLENLDLAAKVIFGFGTMAIAFFTIQLNDEVGDLKQELEERRFGQDQINAAYDRVDRYLALEEATSRRCSAIVLYVTRLPDGDLVEALMEILSAESSNLCVQDAATEVVLAEADPSQPSGIESFQRGFLFAENSSENTDVAVYACENSSDAGETARIATLVGQAIGGSNSFGRVKGSYWRSFDGMIPDLGTITFVVDKDHPEATKLDELENLIMAVLPHASFVAKDNLGQPTRWFISVIACE